MSKPRSVLIIYTGGTIGMVASPSDQGLVAMDLTRLQEQIPELNGIEVQLESLSVTKPIDSSNMLPENWVWLATTIAAHKDDFDGFVILHGSDTMAYTASALSFMLEGLNKPIVLTGSQLPMGVLRTDARENLLTAIEVAAAVHPDGLPMVPEVCVYFEYGLYRGNRTIKVSAERFEAFRTPNYPMLAEAGVHLKYNLGAIKDIEDRKFKLNATLDSAVGLVKLFPGISPDVISFYAQNKKVRAIVLETFGSGNASTDKKFLDALCNAIDKGIAIVNVTQCTGGIVQMGKYETSKKLKEIGVISGMDMTTEAAITKLMVLLGKGCSTRELSDLMPLALNGELTQDFTGVLDV